MICLKEANVKEGGRDRVRECDRETETIEEEKDVGSVKQAEDERQKQMERGTQQRA